LMDRETLDKLGLAPGIVKENITTQGLDFQSLGTGNILRIGSCVLEITGPCDPCARMDEIRMGLQEELRGQRGWLCRVQESGIIRSGDRIDVVTQTAEMVATKNMEERVSR
jgi:MOSC domain-containing protein YiiM